MDKYAILNAIKDLACSQGFYSRLYNDIVNADNMTDILEYLEEQNFNNIMDLIFFFEC